MSAPPALGTLARWAGRLLLGGIFLYAGMVKAGASEQFLVALMPFTFFPPGSLLVVASVLPWAEVVLGVGVLVGSRMAAGVLAVLCLIFSAVLVWALAEGIVVGCSCFGGDETPSAAKMVLAVVRDLFLACLAVWLALGGRPPRQPAHAE